MPRGSAPGERRGGRVAGTPNKITPEIRELARGLFDKHYWERTRQRLETGELPPQLEAKLLAYAYGEPKQDQQKASGVTVNIGFLGAAPEHQPATIEVLETKALPPADNDGL